MSYTLRETLIPFGSLSLGLLATALALHALGCGSDRTPVQGICAHDLDDGNPCTYDHCPDAVTQHTPLADGTACVRGKNSGQCKAGTCKLVCEDAASGCGCDTPVDCPVSVVCSGWACESQRCRASQLAAGTLCVGQVGFCDAAGECGFCVEGTSSGCDAGEVCYKKSSGELGCSQCNDGKLDNDETGVDCGGSCALDKPGPGKKCGLGVKCSVDTDCTSKACVDGVCCSTGCSNVCKSCSEGNAGPGICSDTPTGTTDPACVTTGYVCVAGTMGKCWGRAGAICTAADQCMSGICSMAQCAKSKSGMPCADALDCTPPLTCNANHTCG